MYFMLQKALLYCHAQCAGNVGFLKKLIVDFWSFSISYTLREILGEFMCIHYKTPILDLKEWVFFENLRLHYRIYSVVEPLQIR